MSSAKIDIDASGLHLGYLKVKSFQVKDALAEAAEVVLHPAVESAVPHVSGHLGESWHVAKSRGGSNTIAVGFDSVYARWIHEHLHFHHPHGGGAKYLERPMRVKGPEIMEFAAKRIVNRL